MRVLVTGRMERDGWQADDETPRVTYKVNARAVGILPHRIEAITLGARTEAETPPATEAPAARKEASRSSRKK
jgi:single-strand DNA-binding protein